MTTIQSQAVAQGEVAHNLNPQALTALTLLVAESAPPGRT